MTINRKIIFLYRGPHHVHLKFARSVNAKSCSNYLIYNYKQIPKVFIPFSFLYRFFTLPKADIYLCEDGYSLILAYFQKLFQKNTKIMLIIASPLFYKIGKSKSFVRRIWQKIFTKVNAGIAVSELNKQFAERYLDCPIDVVYPFIDTKKYKYIANLKKNNILYLGSINKFKGVDLMVKAVEEVNKQEENVQFFLCGAVIDRSLEKSLEKYEHSSVYVKNTMRYFKKSMIILNASCYDSFAVSILQGMACGLIPIVTDYTGISIILKKINKNLVVMRRYQDISQAISKILNLSAQKKMNLSKKCRNYALKLNQVRQVKKFRMAFFKLIKEIENN